MLAWIISSPFHRDEPLFLETPLAWTFISNPVKPCVSHGTACKTRHAPPSSEYGMYKTVKTRFWPWLSSKRPQHFVMCSLFARKCPVGTVLRLMDYCWTHIDSAVKFASLRRKGVNSTCGTVSPHGRRDCVKSLRSSYTGLYTQTFRAVAVRRITSPSRAEGYTEP